MEKIYNFAPDELSIDPHRVYRALGYPDPESVSVRVSEIVPGLIQSALRTASPVALTNLETGWFVDSGILRTPGGPAFHARLLSKTLASTTEFIFFVLTIGERISEWIAELSSRDEWTGFIADAVASELVESAMNHFRKILTNNYQPVNLFPTLPFSPGYCDWPLEEMRLLLARIDSERVGVSLTAGGMMKPKKSICGLIGLSTDKEFAGLSPCRDCADESCPYRR